MFAAPHWRALRDRLPDATPVGSRDCGEVVTDHRSSWVRRIAVGDTSIFIKTYEYATWGARLGNWGRWTAPLRAPRSEREWRALTWLREAGFAAPQPLACLTTRRLGFVVRATLVTEEFDGEPADRALPSADPARRAAIARAIGTLVGALHRRGFRDRNLDLRNLLVARPRSEGDDAAPRIANIDSPRHRLVRPARGDALPDDRLAREDWARLLPQLAAFGLDDAARDAAR